MTKTLTKPSRLSDLELILLSTAAARDNDSLMPLPGNVSQDMARIGKAIATLLRRQLIAELPVTDRALCWREADQDLIGLFLTEAGRAAIGAGDESEAESGPNADSQVADSSDPATEPAAGAADATAATVPSAPRPGSKIAAVVVLLERAEGATLIELVAATGWQPHTTRAALTGLRQKGRTIAKAKRDDATCYRIGEAG